MSKVTWKPGTMVYPVPAAMVSCGDSEDNQNIITIAWTGTICTNPPMTYISVRKGRHSYSLIKDSGSFVINLTTKDLCFATDFCGVRSGADIDKFKHLNLTAVRATKVNAPMIEEEHAPVEQENAPVEVKHEPTDMEEDAQHESGMNREGDQREEEMHDDNKIKQ